MNALLWPTTFYSLDTRREALGMSIAALAKRSRVSLEAVEVILSGSLNPVSPGEVERVAEFLGYDSLGREVIDMDTLRQRQAENKARLLVGLVQGTMALEAQAVGESHLLKMTQRTINGLLNGSPQRLWA